jgi:hypothetical protein
MKEGIKDIKPHLWFRDLDWEKLSRKQLKPPFIPQVLSDHDTRHFDLYPEEKNLFKSKSTYGSYGNLFGDFKVAIKNDMLYSNNKICCIILIKLKRPFK